RRAPSELRSPPLPTARLAPLRGHLAGTHRCHQGSASARRPDRRDEPALCRALLGRPAVEHPGGTGGSGGPPRGCTPPYGVPSTETNLHRDRPVPAPLAKAAHIRVVTRLRQVP